LLGSQLVALGLWRLLLVCVLFSAIFGAMFKFISLFAALLWKMSLTSV
jgi:hypothetical protein